MDALIAIVRALGFDGEDDNPKCIIESGMKNNFPCDVSAPIAVSVAIGAGGLALCFVFYLMQSVSLVSECMVVVDANGALMSCSP